MNVRNIALTASALVIGVAGTFFAVRAQGPMYDTVNVDLPYSVTVRDSNLQPGHYVIRQAPSAAGSRVLQIFTNDGMKLETSVMTIPALDNKTPDKTEVILHHFGDDYYFDKIWIQGKDYGYEFPLPDSLKAREKERAAPVTVGGTYEAEPAATNATAQNSEPPAAQEPAATEEKATAAQPASDQPPAAPAAIDQGAQNNEPGVQNQPPASVPSRASDSGSASDTGSRDRSMPDTAAGWLTLMLSGGVLSGAGMIVRRWAR